MLFHSDIPKSCTYCLHSRTEEDGLSCAKGGTASPEGKCFRFRYDPCKRIPPRPKAINFGKYDDEDYTL